MATAFATVVPICACIPFCQKYFTKGIMLGAVKADSAKAGLLSCCLGKE
jgi:hypothetical protein